MAESARELREMERALIEASREDSAIFTQFIFGYKNAPFHNMWHQWWNQGQSGLILSYRSSGKSEQLMGRLLWEIGRNQNIRIKIATESVDLGKDILNKVSATILYNENFHKVFPHIKPDRNGEWSATKLRIERTTHYKDPTLSVSGILTAKTGGRADLLIFDDVCFDDQTEIFTNNGWKLFKDLLSEDKVATLDNNGFFEWQSPQRYICKDYMGDMYIYDSKLVNFAVTAGHNMYVAPFKDPYNRIADRQYSLVPIENIYNKSGFSFKKNCDWRGVSSPIIIDNREVSLSDFAALIGFFVAEGYVNYYKEVVKGITICQNEGSVLQEFLVILNNLNLSYKIYSSTYNRKKIYIANQELGLFFSQFGRGAKNKCLPEWLLNWDKHLLQIFFAWFKKGDGGHHHLYTSSYKLSYQLQEVALKIGICLRERSKVSLPKKYTMKCGNVFNLTQPTINYELTINSKCLQPTTEQSIRKNYWRKETYNGKVYCVTVPNSVIYVRRNKISLWAGNCGMRNSLVQPKMRSMTIDAAFSNWFPMLADPSSRWWCVGTPWHVEDFITLLRNKPDIAKCPEVKVGPNFESPWPERHSSEYFKDILRERGRISFNRGYRLIPVSSDESWINKDVILTFRNFNLSMKEIAANQDYTKFMGVDLGHRSGSTACPTVIFTIALAGDGTRFPCDIRISKDASPLNIARLIINAANELNPSLIFVENVGAQQYLIEILKEFGGHSHRIEGYFTGNQKMDLRTGIPSLMAEMEGGKWVFPYGDNSGTEKEHDAACSCNLCKWLGELYDFPNGTTDCTMASWFALMALRKIKGGTGQGNFSVWTVNF